MNAASVRGVVALLSLGMSTAAADDSALTVADLAAYRAALSEPAGPGIEPVAVRFRDLWEHPETYRGRRVRVEGRVVRRFRQGAVGTFPPLAETWAVTPQGDPFCLVCAETKGEVSPPRGGTVRFVGTFLRQVRYQGRDGPRLAPLIVGARPPVAIADAPGPPRARESEDAWLDWTIGLTVAALAALALIRRHANRPVRRPPDPGPPPAFLAPGDDAG